MRLQEALSIAAKKNRYTDILIEHSLEVAEADRSASPEIQKAMSVMALATAVPKESA